MLYEPISYKIFNTQNVKFKRSLDALQDR